MEGGQHAGVRRASVQALGKAATRVPVDLEAAHVNVKAGAAEGGGGAEPPSCRGHGRHRGAKPAPQEARRSCPRGPEWASPGTRAPSHRLPPCPLVPAGLVGQPVVRTEGQQERGPVRPGGEAAEPQQTLHHGQGRRPEDPSHGRRKGPPGARGPGRGRGRRPLPDDSRARRAALLAARVLVKTAGRPPRALWGRWASAPLPLLAVGIGGGQLPTRSTRLVPPRRGAAWGRAPRGLLSPVRPHPWAWAASGPAARPGVRVSPPGQWPQRPGPGVARSSAWIPDSVGLAHVPPGAAGAGSLFLRRVLGVGLRKGGGILSGPPQMVGVDLNGRSPPPDRPAAPQGGGSRVGCWQSQGKAVRGRSSPQWRNLTPQHFVSFPDRSPPPLPQGREGP